ncbi:hypothetical protein DYU11_01635 [Fibrisoma montanum]|uniref:Uncharacterized protein n=1 Tax=Fibrisoma montanum TaxID=2305895 RepID=A0A418MHZ0_9BACT|nr:hypothetical protein [Fibrisoma montanum]RIV27045.1 hypothetical protein DYU11_01635 [Fibrisoma montanum]
MTEQTTPETAVKNFRELVSPVEAIDWLERMFWSFVSEYHPTTLKVGDEPDLQEGHTTYYALHGLLIDLIKIELAKKQ